MRRRVDRRGLLVFLNRVILIINLDLFVIKINYIISYYGYWFVDFGLTGFLKASVEKKLQILLQ